MPDSFGARLRQRRERQQIALSTIAEQTKIKVSLLEALEQDDVSHWPSGIFRRAFLRAYAHAIGLEPDSVVREFLELYPDPAEVVATLPAVSPGGQDGYTGGPPTRLRNLVGSAIGSLSRLGSRAASKPGSTATTPPIAFNRIDQDYPARMPEVLDHTDPGPLAVPAPLDRVEDSQPAQPRIEPVPPPLSTDPNPLTPRLPSAEPDLLAVAHLCTALGRVDASTDIAPLLREATDLLEAVGLIVWIWDAQAVELRPVLAHGYSDQVLAQLPRVDRDTNNATAAAFRAGRTCVVNSSRQDSGALVVPLMTAAGCAGVLAIELQDGREESESVRALSMVFAAQLATLIGSAQPAEASDRRLA